MSEKKNESIKKAGALMLQGWAMLGEHCPICHTALLTNRERTEMLCTTCNLPVKREADIAHSGASSASTAPTAPAPAPVGTDTLYNNVVKSSASIIQEYNTASGQQIGPNTTSSASSSVTAVAAATPAEEDEDYDEDDIIEPASLEEMKNEWDRKNKSRDLVSSKLAEAMMTGWTLLATTCPRSKENHPELEGVVQVGKGEVTKCVACEGKIGRPASTPAASLSSSAAGANSPPAPAPALSRATISAAPPTAPVHAPLKEYSAQTAEDITDKASSLIGNYLLKGYTLLDDTCKALNAGVPCPCYGKVPLVQRSGTATKLCVICEDSARQQAAAGSKSILASSSTSSASASASAGSSTSAASSSVPKAPAAAPAALKNSSNRNSGGANNKLSTTGSSATGSNNSNNNNRRRRRVAWSASVVEDYEGAEGNWSANTPGSGTGKGRGVGGPGGYGDDDGEYNSSLSSGSENDFYDDDLVVANLRSRKNKHAAGGAGNANANSSTGAMNSASGGQRFGFVSDVIHQKIFALTKEMDNIGVGCATQRMDGNGVGPSADLETTMANLRLIKDYAATIADLVGVVNAINATK